MSLTNPKPDRDQYTIRPDDEMILAANGKMNPKRWVRPAVLLEDQTVHDMCDRAAALSATLAAFRESMFDDVEAFLNLISEKYGAKPRSRGTVSLLSYDGLLRVEVSTGHFLSLGPELQAAKSLIDDCLTAWSEGANENLRAIVNDAFEVGAEGKLRVDRILALRRVAIDDHKWRAAMEAISDAVRVTHSKRYVRFHQRATPDTPWKQIVLDVARVA